GLRGADGVDEAGHAARPRRPHQAAAPGAARPRDPVRDPLDGGAAGPDAPAPQAEHAGPTTGGPGDRLRGTVPPCPPGGPGTAGVRAIEGRRRALGVLAVVPRHGEGLAGLDDNDRTVLYLVVRRVGMAVENVRLYAREHRLAETLQRAMLPQQAEVR